MAELLEFTEFIHKTKSVGFRPSPAIKRFIEKQTQKLGISKNLYCNLVFDEFIKSGIIIEKRLKNIRGGKKKTLRA